MSRIQAMRAAMLNAQRRVEDEEDDAEESRFWDWQRRIDALLEAEPSGQRDAVAILATAEEEIERGGRHNGAEVIALRKVITALERGLPRE